MDISLTWQDLLKLGANGKVEKGENTISVPRPVMPALKPSDGKQMVCFTLDKSDPRSMKTT
jgi:hypothetical protein